MRVGNNPAKNGSKLEEVGFHRVIIPVYIPNLDEGYFKDGLEILKFCLESLLSSTNDSLRLSVFNNGSCESVGNYLKALFSLEERFDQLLHSKVNVGKVNAINAVVKSTKSVLYTISDADVMFLQGWQQNVEEIFYHFPEAGMVSPVPSSKAFSNHTSSTLYYSLFKGKLSFEKVRDPEALRMFEHSIGTSLYKDCHYDKYFVVSNRSGKKAVLGCGHFVATLKKEVFHYSPNKPSEIKISGGSEAAYIDIPNDEGGFLRLATLGNFAYHLGNVVEPWMKEKHTQNMGKSVKYASENLVRANRISSIGKMIAKILSKLFFGSASFLLKKIYRIPSEY